MTWPFLLTVAYFGAQHSLSLMLADWFWPLHHYSLANHVPYGYQNWSDATATFCLAADRGPSGRSRCWRSVRVSWFLPCLSELWLS